MWCSILTISLFVSLLISFLYPQSSAIDYEGWEYARFHDSSYQRSYNALFLARRRRHIRKIKTSNRKNLSNLPRFYFSDVIIIIAYNNNI